MAFATQSADRIRPRSVVAWLLAACAGCGPPPPDAGANPFGEGGGDGDAADVTAGPTEDSTSTTGASTTGGSTIGGSTTGDATIEPSTASSTTAPSSGTGADGGASSSSEGTSDGGGDESSAGPPGTSSSDGAEGGVADTFDDGVVHVLVEIQAMWDAGECDDITVTNMSDGPVSWEVDLPLPGVVYQLWNAEMVEMDGVGTFVGVDFNAELPPGAAAMFGFCVNY